LPDNAWLGGWSLGGMLASELAARRGERCCGLVTLASNPRFVAHEDWPSAMPAQTFDGFLAGCHADTQVTLKRFSCCAPRARQDPRGIARLLVSSAPATPSSVLMSGA
jgi:pimeloyl-[acyl-carrier protein] methyl ester esterase